MTATQTEPRPVPNAGRIFLIVGGALAGLIALAALAGGGALVAAHTTQRDADGFYATRTTALTTPTSALVSDRLDVGVDGPDVLFRKGRLGTIRVTATGTDAKPVFVGIARVSQVNPYLKGVAHDEITDFEVDPFTVTYTRRPGATTPAAPTDQTFWAETASGSGKQTLSWPVQKGTWDVVVMNADGTPDVRTRVSVGAKVPAVLWLGIGLLTAGGILATAGALPIYFGTRRPRHAPTSATAEGI